MSDLAARIANLPLEKRRRLELLLRAADARPQPQGMARRAADGPAPLSFAQQRLWFLNQLEPQSASYNTRQPVRLSGALNVAALRRSLNDIIRRHGSLRTTFTVADGEPVQVIGAAWDITLPVIEVPASPQTEAEVQRHIVDESLLPFDLKTGPLLRASLLRLSAEEHVLLLTTHHIVADGWSFNVFLQELAALYEAYCVGAPSPLAELPLQYTDFAAWQREYLQGEFLETQLSYWKQQLGGTLPILELPTDRPRPAMRNYRGETEAFALPAALSESLRQMSRREGVTLFMTLLAAFDVLLSRYTGQEDIVVGTPIAGRNRAEIENLIGFFVNTMVLRTQCGDNPTFRELLGRVRETTLSAYSHQDLPFEKLVEELQPERSLSHTPLFQTLFTLQNTPRPSITLPGLRFETSTLGVDIGTGKLDLALLMEETPEGLAGLFEYNTDLFDAATIKRMGGHFQTLLEGIVAHPEWPVAALPLLTKAERRQLVVELNNTQAEYPKDSCVHELFEAQAERSPDLIALVFEDERLTYRELNRRANQLAHHLRSLGLTPESVVGICVERSPEMVLGMLGVLKAGGAYLPLDPGQPAERLDFMLKDAGVEIILTQRQVLEVLPAHEAHLINLDADWGVIAQHDESNPEGAATPDNLAYTIYTSGSTGQPKGVMVAHRGVCNTLTWRQRAFSLTEADRILQTIPFTFDPSVWQIFGTLLSGGRLVLARPGGHREVAYLRGLMAEQHITVADFPPSMLQVMLNELAEEPCRCLRHVFCGGEVLPTELAARFLDTLDATLHNVYGPTEASIDATCHTCRVEDNHRSVLIGRPIANAQVYLLDAHLQPVPPGVPGELYIGGDGLARGYLNRPELTAERFIPNSFIDQPGARLYRTGDIARYLPDGSIEYLGRVDQQVKVRGFRIELGEIEAALGAHPAVRECVVEAREESTGGKQLVAYAVAEQGQTPTSGELRAFLKNKLPDYMIPSVFVPLGELPLMSNGKVDRRALPALAKVEREAEAAYKSPGTEAEHLIAALWQEALGIEKVGVSDNFFDLGGHSLMLIQIHGKLRALFSQEITISEMFQYPTVSSLAQYLSQGQNGQSPFQDSHNRAGARNESARRLRQIRRKH
ncbi:MAG TPA: amino acid adenylation domain-containing protein [Pyrinomonadaceae bacterium]